MNVLFVCENYLPHIGGAEIVFKNLAESLVKQGHTVNLVTHKLPKTLKYEVIGGVHVHRVSCFDSRYLFTFFAIPKVFQLAGKADVIHTTTFNGAPPAWLVSRLRRKKCILTVHEVWVGKWKRVTDKSRFSVFVHNLLEKMIYLLPFDHYACVSQYTQKNLARLGVGDGKTSVIHNGVDYDHFLKEYSGKEVRARLGVQDNFVLLTYGRPGPSKGIGVVIRAMPWVLKKIPHARLVLMLSKDTAYQEKYAELRTLVASLGLEKHVLFADPVAWEALPNYVKAANCVVVPSLAEGFGFAAAETAALDVPVVVTNAGSLPEVVSGTHIVVEAGSATALAEGVVSVFEHRATKTALKKFTIEDNIEKYVQLYTQLQPL
jgi:D-inositol-3-phosphate glycosyltransferase